ncbi:hypothetical protein VP01_512g10 [Puccinia sorghi]|uniref:Uncharacterized protein n=1 Tax=Puccinia sorghi TaxID=27349 RepID=A0A0L6UL27_9BASI|nr:hypothetical protein VP01_512g10 [Puccinia sorghi]
MTASTDGHDDGSATDCTPSLSPVISDNASLPAVVRKAKIRLVINKSDKEENTCPNTHGNQLNQRVWRADHHLMIKKPQWCKAPTLPQKGKIGLLIETTHPFRIYRRMSDSDKPATAERQTQLQPTDSTAKMDDSSSAIEKRKVIALETAIKAIPILTQDNFTAWKQRVLNFLENLKAKDVFVKGEGKLSTDDELFIRTIITARLDASVQANVINNQNATNVLLIWEAIINYFASEESANRARIWDEFTYYNFDESDITGFITRIKSSIEKMHEVGIQIDTDIVAYEILKKFPKTTEMNAMKTAITHTPGRITPTVVLDHLRTHGHNLTLGGRSKISSSTQVSLFSDPSKKCKPNAHNTLAPHPKDRCYMLYPHLRPPPGSNYQGQKPRAENSKTE